MNLQNLNCLLIDLDDTLYPHSNGVWDMIRERINHFLINEMNFPEDSVASLRTRLFQQYGTTLRGLQNEFSVNMEAYLDYVHNVPLETAIAPDPDLDRILKNIPHRKVIFTNANKTHAQRVMDLMGVSDHFNTIVDVYALAPHCKPEVKAFHKALALIDEKPNQCLLIDDSPANLETARSLGIRTISIGARRHKGSPHIDNIHHLEIIFSD
jgi:putative hydrolase of the HAD superfamily